MFRLSFIFGAIDDCFESFWAVQEEWFRELLGCTRGVVFGAIDSLLQNFLIAFLA